MQVGKKQIALCEEAVMCVPNELTWEEVVPHHNKIRQMDTPKPGMNKAPLITMFVDTGAISNANTIHNNRIQ